MFNNFKKIYSLKVQQGRATMNTLLYLVGALLLLYVIKHLIISGFSKMADWMLGKTE
jgi:hypothetical protein